MESSIQFPKNQFNTRQRKPVGENPMGFFCCLCGGLSLTILKRLRNDSRAFLMSSKSWFFQCDELARLFSPRNLLALLSWIGYDPISRPFLLNEQVKQHFSLFQPRHPIHWKGFVYLPFYYSLSYRHSLSLR